MSEEVDIKHPKTARRRHDRRPKFIFGLILVIVLVVMAGFVISRFYHHEDVTNVNNPIVTPSSAEKNKNNSAVAETPAAEKQEEKTEEKPAEAEPEKKEEEPDDTSKTPARYETSDPNVGTDLTGSISYVDVQGNNYLIRANIDQYLTSGTCALTMTPRDFTGATIKRTADIITSASTSTCDGFDIPLTEVEIGTYDVKIVLTSGSKSGQITSESTISAAE